MSDAEEFWKRNRSEKAQRKIRKQAKLYGVDHKALNILWNSVKDLDAFDPALTKYLEPPAEDVAYATAQGLIHPPRTLTHDEIIAELQSVVRSIDREAIAGAFAASLKSGRLDFQSALGSYAFHLHHPTHAPQIEVYGVRSHLQRCTVCRLGGAVGETTYQVVRLPLLRMAGGGIQTKYASYALGDLLSFQDGEVLEPRDADWDVLGQVLDNIRALPADAQLEALSAAPQRLVKGNKYDRQRVLEVLGFCGILRSKDRPGVLGQWFSSHHALPASYYKKEWRYPVCWWTGADGVDEEAVAYWFPKLAR